MIVPLFFLLCGVFILFFGFVFTYNMNVYVFFLLFACVDTSVVSRVRPGAKVGSGLTAELKPRELTVAESPMLTTKRRSVIRSSSIAGVRVVRGSMFCSVLLFAVLCVRVYGY